MNAIKAKYGGYVKAEQLAEAGNPLSDIGEQLRLCGEMRSMGIEPLKTSKPRALRTWEITIS